MINLILLDDISLQPNCVYDVYVSIEGALSGWTTVVDSDSSITALGLAGIGEEAFSGPSTAILTLLYTGSDDRYYETGATVAQAKTEQ